MKLENKKILFFAPNSFGYEFEIKKELERQGGFVEYYDERPSNSTFVKALIRINKKKIRFYTNRYFTNITNKYQFDNFDYIFVLRGEAMSPSILQNFKSHFPKAKLILYLWDSIKNNNTLDTIPYFNRVYTFDTIDHNKYSDLLFRPLFFLPEYRDIKRTTSDLLNDVLFVGTVHSDRYAFIKKIEVYLKKKNYQTDFYFFFQSRLLFYKKRITDSSFSGLSQKDFHFESLNKKDLLQKVANSHVILDIQHPNQNGLTMRCIETLGAKRKLITTNKEIIKYDFYHKNNIFIIGRDLFQNEGDVEKLSEFLKLPYIDISSSIYNIYSIESWINEVFSI